jgi:hypothetical protein
MLASERFHQALSGKIVGYYHDLAGAAQNAAETGNLKQVISSGASWQKIHAFIENESRNYGAQIKQAIAAAPSPYSAVLYMSQYGNGTPRVSSTGMPEPTRRNPVSSNRGAGVELNSGRDMSNGSSGQPPTRRPLQ